MTSMKTIIARFTELKENVAGTEESEFQDLDLNRVDKALKSVGVQLKDTTGQFRDLDDVFMELSSIWQDLDRNTQRYVATIAAGSRQQSRFLALMDGYERNVELMQIAADSTGQADKQFEKYSDTMEFRLNSLATKWEQLRQSILNEEFFKGVLDQGSNLLDKILDLNLTPQKAAVIIPFAALMARNFLGTFLTNIQASGAVLNSLGSFIGEKITYFAGQQIEKGITWVEDKTRNVTVSRAQKKVDKVQSRYDIIAQEDQQIQRTKNNIKGYTEALKEDTKAQEENIKQIQQRIEKYKEEKIAATEAAEAASNFPRIRGKKKAQKKAALEENLRIKRDEEAQATKRLEEEERKLQQAEKDLQNTQRELSETTEQLKIAEENAVQSTEKLNKAEQQLTQANLNLDVATGALPNMAQRFGGLRGAVSATGAAVQNLSGNFGMMIAMMASGAKAEDTLRMAISSFTMIAVSQTLPAIKSIIAARKADTLAMENELVVEALKTHKTYEGAAAALAQSAAESINAGETNKASAAKEAETLATNANTAAKTANVAVTTLGIAAAAIIIALLIKAGIEESKRRREMELSTTAMGKENETIANQRELLEELSDRLSKVSEKARDAKESFDLFKKAEKYAGENQKYFSEEEAQEWLSIQQQIAEKYPELISYYDQEGNAILNLAQYWAAATQAKLEYYEANTQEALAARTASQAELNIAEANQRKAEHAGKLVGTEEDPFSWLTRIMYDYDENGGLGERRWTKEEFSTLDAYNRKDAGIRFGQEVVEAITGISNTDYEAYTTIIEALRHSFLVTGTSGISSEDLDKLTIEELKEKIVEKAKNSEWVIENLFPVMDSITSDTEGFVEAWKISSTKDVNIATNKINNYTKQIAKNIALQNEVIQGKNQNIQELITQGILDELNNKYSEQEINNLTEEQLTFEINTLLKEDFEKITFSKEEEKVLSDAIEEYGDSLQQQYNYIVENGSDKLAERFKNLHKASFESIEANAKTMKDLAGENSETYKLYEKLGENAQETFSEGFQKGTNNAGKEAAQEYYDNFSEILNEKFGSSKAIDYAVSFDFSEINNLNKENKKAEFTSGVLNLDDSFNEDEINKIFNKLYDNAQRFKDVIDIKDITKGTFEAAISGVEAVSDVVLSHSKTIQKYSGIVDGEALKITQEQGRDIEKFLTDLKDPKKGNINAALFEDILQWDEKSNQYLFNRDKLIKIIRDNSIEILEAAKQSGQYSEKEIKSLEAQNYLLQVNLGLRRSISDTIEAFSGLTSSFTSAASEQIKEGYVSAKSIQSLLQNTANLGLNPEKMASFFNDKMNFDIPSAYNYINSQIKNLEAQTNLNEADKEQLLIWQALKKELYIANLELQNEAENTDEVADAWKDYNKQLDTVKEKQEALNDKIEAYNKLLYGDDLRKSGLDLLYNYNEAISTFNDEMSRAQDILSDAKNMEDATAAFEQYAAATHNLIVEEKAKQEQLQRGLNEYARMIEHGYASYTDTQTGRTIGINFGDYAKFDQSTGKYIINQTLLNRAKFNDDYKDLIEEYVENYNKYADEYKKSQDEVLKTEKEFQKLRKEALKNYADFEKSIADELKSQYEEEVDNLKEKYDAMKEEDDDYIKALQEAIDKQRKLRDRESKFEDLAKKEKKLSLISRDTSGANRLQELQLEEEIQKSRQDLLDEQVDNIIDGMQKLYESQEETRNVEIELKEAIIDNTALINSQAEELGRGFTDVDSYIEFMTQSKEFTELTYVQQLEKIEEYRETYAAAAQYMAMQNMDATAKSGDFIKEIIETTSEEIAWAVSNTSSTFVDEASRAYQAVSREVSESLDNAVKDIQNARDALKEAIEKLDEYARKAKELEEKRNYQADQNLGNPGADYIPDVHAPSSVNQYEIQEAMDKEAKRVSDKMLKIDSNFGWAGHDTKQKMIDQIESQSINDQAMRKTLVEEFGLNPLEIAKWTSVKRKEELISQIKKFEAGGLVDFTGPAWVDGTKSAPEAFLNPEDTRRIGEAARILSNLPFFNSYGEANETITNNNGNVSIEINLNVDKLSSEIDVNEMLNRVKEEIVSVARPAGINTILTQQ